MEKFIVLEIQTNTEGEVSTLVNAYDNQNEARNKYHTILAAAALSNLPVHTAVIMRNNGEQFARETFFNDITE